VQGDVHDPHPAGHEHEEGLGRAGFQGEVRRIALEGDAREVHSLLAVRAADERIDRTRPDELEALVHIGQHGPAALGLVLPEGQARQVDARHVHQVHDPGFAPVPAGCFDFVHVDFHPEHPGPVVDHSPGRR